jgi:hypothetical protein
MRVNLTARLQENGVKPIGVNLRLNAAENGVKPQPHP